MSFYKEIQPFSEYLNSIRILENYITIDLKFPSNWGLPKSLTTEDKIVPFDSGDSNTKGLSFVSPMDEKDVSDLISKITKVIKLNKEREQKEQLFKNTVERLKKTFEQNELDKLKDLYFDFATDQEDTSNLEIYDTEQSETFGLVEERAAERPKRPRTGKKEVNSGI